MKTSTSSNFLRRLLALAFGAMLFAPAATGWGQTSTQNFGTTAATNSSQTGSTSTIPNPTGSGTTWARGGVTVPNAPIIVATNAPNPLGTTGAYLRAVASTSTSVSKASPVASYTNATTEFYTSFKVLFGNSSGASGAASGIWQFFQGTGAQYTDNNSFSGAPTCVGLQFTYGASGAVTLNYRNTSAWVTTSLTSSALSQGTVYTIEIMANNKSSGTISYTYNGVSRSVAVQKFDLYVNGSLVGDDISTAQLSAGSTINATTFMGLSSTSNAANIFVDDFVVYNAVPASIGASAPTINTSGSLASFSTEAGTASAAQTFNATGAALTADITVTAPTDFEVATDGATFGDTATITQSGGSASGTVSVRIKAAATAGAKSGNIVLSSAGATDVNVPVSGTVTAAGAAVVNLSTTSISNLSTSVGVASAVTNYVVTGTNLGTTAVTITPSEAFLEIGTNGTNFASTIDLSPTDGAVSNTVFLRVAAANSATNSYSATVSHVSGSASNSLAVTGAITNLPPVLAVSTNTLSGFTTTTSVPSTAQTFTVTGSNLTTNVTVGAPTGFQVANDGTTWGTNTSLTPVTGDVSNTISVRLAASNVPGPFSGNVTVASTGATQRTVALSGLVESPSVPGLVYWNFNSATPTSGTNGDYAAWTFGPLTQSNNNGTTALFTSTSPSSGYTNPFNVPASGGTNAGAAARTGAFNAASNAFFEVQVVVPSNTTTSITNISFGSRSTGTGPAAYSIRSSVDGFAADLATNALTNNSAWAMNVAPVAIALSNGTNTVRIYGFNGAGSATAGTANWRIDDLTLALGTGTGPTPPSGLSYTPSTTNAVVGTAIGNLVPSVTGTVTNYSVSPTLPAGLSIDPNTGVISGTPSAAAPADTYTVTASNAGGSTTATVTISVASAYQGWLNGQPQNSANQLKYAIGGASNALATNGIAMSNAVTATDLLITAIVRTNDTNLRVFGQSIVNLATETWGTSDVTRTTEGVDQTGVPAGNQRQIFSTPLGAEGKKFLRLQTTLSNQ